MGVSEYYEVLGLTDGSERRRVVTNVKKTRVPATAGATHAGALGLGGGFVGEMDGAGAVGALIFVPAIAIAGDPCVDLFGDEMNSGDE